MIFVLFYIGFLENAGSPNYMSLPNAGMVKSKCF
jgi:hypothetical protein